MSEIIGPSTVPLPEKIDLSTLGGTLYTNVQRTWGQVDSLFEMLNTSLSNLSEVVGDYKSKLDRKDIAFQDMDNPQFPARPGWAALVLDSLYPDGYIPEPVYRDLGPLDFNLVAPAPPSEVSQGFNWIAKEYTSENWVTLYSLVHSRLLNGVYGLSEAAHAALVAMEQETRRRNQDKEFRQLLNAAGTSGFNLPGGRVSALLANFSSEVLQRDQDSLNNITAKNFDIANDREKFFIGTAVEMEKMLQGAFDKAEDRSLDAAKAAVEYVWKFFSENIKLFLGKYEGEKLRLEGVKVRVDAITAANKNETDKLLGMAQILEAKIRAITEKNKGLVDARKGEVETYGIEVTAVKEQYLALVEQLRVNNDAMSKAIDKEIAMEQVDLTAYLERTKLLQTIGLGISQILSQGFASTLGSMNWTIGNSYTGHESNSVSFDAGIRESQSHNYNHPEE